MQLRKHENFLCYIEFYYIEYIYDYIKFYVILW